MLLFANDVMMLIAENPANIAEFIEQALEERNYSWASNSQRGPARMKNA